MHLTLKKKTPVALSEYNTILQNTISNKIRSNCFGQICLGGGGKSATYAYGNVFVFGQPICDDGWTNTDAIVVCRQIGFPFGTATSSS